MRRRGGLGFFDRIQFLRTRPVLAVALSVISVLVILSAITLTTPLRCIPAKALGLKGIESGCVTVGSVALRRSPTPGPYPTPASAPYYNPASPPYGNPASAPYGNPASGPYPPVGYPASGTYPPFVPPASAGGYAFGSRPELNCRLPVFAGPPGSGGFIVFPGGNFLADPNSSVTVPATTPTPTPAPVGGPGPGYGQGYGALSYDHQFSKWVPVPAVQVSPDGSRYAYTPSDGIYIVSVPSGTQTEVGQGHAWTIIAVQADGVYAADPNAGGLWLFPFSGTARQITNSGYWRAANATAAFGTATSAVPQGATNSIIRLDLKTGATSEWFARDGASVGVSGFDGTGDPIISVYYLNGSGNEIWIAPSPTSATAIAGFSNPPYGASTGFTSYSQPVADSHGVWFAGNYSSYGNNATGVALYVPGSGFYWMSSIGGQLAGGCY
jgi:hypothetical protein